MLLNPGHFENKIYAYHISASGHQLHESRNGGGKIHQHGASISRIGNLRIENAKSKPSQNECFKKLEYSFENTSVGTMVVTPSSYYIPCL